MVAAEEPGAVATRGPIDPGVDIGHVHLKGLDHGRFCEFGVGDLDLVPVLQALLTSGYRGAFTVEYEGPYDQTLRLYQSVQRARSVMRSLSP